MRLTDLSDVINRSTGRATTGMTTAEVLADLVLGNRVKKAIMPALLDSPIQKQQRLAHSYFKMKVCK